MLLSEAFKQYKRDVIAYGNQSRKTEEHHFLALKSLVKHIGDVDVSSLTFEHIRDWKSALEDERKSVNTVRGYIVKLRCVLKYLMKNKIDSLDPDLVAIPKREQKVPTWITPEEVTKLIDATPFTRSKCIISLLYASGIRVSELCSLNIDQMVDGRFTVVGKNNKPRLCFYDKRTALLLRRYLDMRSDNNPALFVQRISKTRIRPSGVQEILIHARRLAHIDKCITPHTLRHSYATDLMQSGASIHNVQRLMGHTNIATTSLYLHSSDVRLQEEYAKYHSV